MQAAMGDLPQLKEDLEQKITTWQREADMKLMKSVWGAHVRIVEEDNFSQACVWEPPRAYLCYCSPRETGLRDLLFAYQGLKDSPKDAEPVEDLLPASIHQGASSLHSNEDLEHKIQPLEPRVQKLMRTYPEMLREVTPCNLR